MNESSFEHRLYKAILFFIAGRLAYVVATRRLPNEDQLDGAWKWICYAAKDLYADKDKNQAFTATELGMRLLEAVTPEGALSEVVNRELDIPFLDADAENFILSAALDDYDRSKLDAYTTD